MLIGKLSRLHFDFIRAGGSGLQGPNSIDKFWLEKSLEFSLEIPYTKKMFKNRSFRHVAQNQNGISSHFSSQKAKKMSIESPPRVTYVGYNKHATAAKESAASVSEEDFADEDDDDDDEIDDDEEEEEEEETSDFIEITDDDNEGGGGGRVRKL